MKTAETIETILKILGIATPIGAFIAWGLGNLLSAKKDMVILQTQFDDLCEEFAEYKKDQAQVKRDLERKIERNKEDFDRYKERNPK